MDITHIVIFWVDIIVFAIIFILVVTYFSALFKSRGEEIDRLKKQHALEMRQVRERTEHFKKLAGHDDLTNLPNRRMFDEILFQRCAEYRRTYTCFALLYFDVRKFKDLNDTAGHAAGDTLLKLASKALMNASRTQDTVARIGGDEFAVVLPNVTEVAIATRIAMRANMLFLKYIQAEFAGANVNRIRFNWGISTPDEFTAESDITVLKKEMVTCADTRMYEQKNSHDEG